MEWCDRTLLARIHRATVQRLRAEIEPVSTQDFVRFLFRWQHVGAHDKRQGPDALDAVIAQLQGFEAPAAAWEAELLPARLDEYDFTWLDDLCLSGRAAWTRLTAPSGAGSGSAGPIRTTPVTLVPRRTAALWTRAAPAPLAEPALGSRAHKVAEHLRAHGASFFDEIVDGTRLLRTQVEDALSSSWRRDRSAPTASRACARCSRRRASASASAVASGDAARCSASRMRAAGRSCGARARPPRTTPSTRRRRSSTSPTRCCGRYGVVFWRLLQREAAWLPPWRDLLRVLRRLEARGDVRGGRFVAGISGEQFALPEAVGLLRETRRAPVTGTLVSVSGADPLNLVGTLLPGPRIAALAGNRVLFRTASHWRRSSVASCNGSQRSSPRTCARPRTR
jgi:ATP-dependent Lhr-like helicase